MTGTGSSCQIKNAFWNRLCPGLISSQAAKAVFLGLFRSACSILAFFLFVLETNFCDCIFIYQID